MRYEKICRGKFIDRPNRFVAKVNIEEEEPGGEAVSVHVKNTGRCKEILIPGTEVILEDFRHRMGSRKMEYSLIAAYKEDMLINIDSQAPNKAVAESLKKGELILPELQYPLTVVKAEKTYGSSRLDFYVEDSGEETEKAFIEVKGVTLEENGIVRFPDAPTERGTKHIKELIGAKKEGFKAYIVFVVQMEWAQVFEPNKKTDPLFSETLKLAEEEGVGILAYTCKVEADSMELSSPLPVKIG